MGCFCILMYVFKDYILHNLVLVVSQFINRCLKIYMMNETFNSFDVPMCIHIAYKVI